MGILWLLYDTILYFQVRLARNLLQTVIGNWYARDPTITSCFSQLQQLAVCAAGAMLNDDLNMMGSCINDYWSLKKMVASGCEPSKVKIYKLYFLNALSSVFMLTFSMLPNKPKSHLVLMAYLKMVNFLYISIIIITLHVLLQLVINQSFQ